MPRAKKNKRDVSVSKAEMQLEATLTRCILEAQLEVENAMTSWVKEEAKRHLVWAQRAWNDFCRDRYQKAANNAAKRE